MVCDFRETIAIAKSVQLFVPYWVCNDVSLPVAYHVVAIDPSHSLETNSSLLTRAIKDAK